jgi:hypothetical protein
MKPTDAKRAARLVDFIAEMEEWLETFYEDDAAHTEIRSDELYFSTAPDLNGGSESKSYEGFHAPRDLMRKGIEHMKALAEAELKSLGVEASEN